MRLSLLPPTLLFTVTTALQIPSLQPFLSAISLPINLQDYIPAAFSNNNTSGESAHDLLKRQYSNTCPDHFDSCANLGAPGLCCASAAKCSADAAGHVACCPSGAVCSGTIGGVITAGTVNSYGSVIGTGTSAVAGGGQVTTETTSTFVPAGSTTAGLVPASTPSTVGNGGSTSGGNGGFIVAGSSTVASPAAAVRRADIPFAAKVILSVLEYLPMMR